MSPEKIYDLTRRYRQSKYNPGFNNIIVPATPLTTNITCDYYLVIYKWSQPPTVEFIMLRHGNASNPMTSSYFRQDPTALYTIDDMLDEGLSTAAIYSALTKEDARTANEMVHDPKVISNRKYEKERDRLTGTLPNEITSNCTEADFIIQYLKDDAFIRTCPFNPSEYCTVNYHPQMLVDLERFSVKGAIFMVDTTFEICEGLWLTDTSYSNLSLGEEEWW